jgi:hypothetical protein
MWKFTLQITTAELGTFHWIYESTVGFVIGALQAASKQFGNDCGCVLLKQEKV